MRSTLYGELGDILMCSADQHQDGDVWRDLKEPIECLDAATIRQKEVNQYRRYAGHRSSLFWVVQSLDRLRTMSDPFGFEEAIGRITQRALNAFGLCRIVLDQE